MKVRSTYFTLKIPVELEELKDDLAKEFPEYEFSIYGIIGKGIMVKKMDSGFVGVRIEKGLGIYKIFPKPVSLIGRLIYAFTFEAFNMPSSYKMCKELREFLIERYK